MLNLSYNLESLTFLIVSTFWWIIIFIGLGLFHLVPCTYLLSSANLILIFLPQCCVLFVTYICELLMNVSAAYLPSWIFNASLAHPWGFSQVWERLQQNIERNMNFLWVFNKINFITGERLVASSPPLLVSGFLVRFHAVTVDDAIISLISEVLWTLCLRMAKHFARV